MMDIVKIADMDGLERDKNSKCIMSTDKMGLHAYRRNKERVQNRDDRLNKLESDVNEMKAMLQILLNR